MAPRPAISLIVITRDEEELIGQLDRASADEPT